MFLLIFLCLSQNFSVLLFFSSFSNKNFCLKQSPLQRKYTLLQFNIIHLYGAYFLRPEKNCLLLPTQNHCFSRKQKSPKAHVFLSLSHKVSYHTFECSDIGKRTGTNICLKYSLKTWLVMNSSSHTSSLLRLAGGCKPELKLSK